MKIEYLLLMSLFAFSLSAKAAETQKNSDNSVENTNTITTIEQRSREISETVKTVGSCYDTGQDGFYFGTQHYAFDVTSIVKSDDYLVKSTSKYSFWTGVSPVSEQLIPESDVIVSEFKTVSIDAGPAYNAEDCNNKRTAYLHENDSLADAIANSSQVASSLNSLIQAQRNGSPAIISANNSISKSQVSADNNGEVSKPTRSIGLQ